MFMVHSLDICLPGMQLLLFLFTSIILLLETKPKASHMLVMCSSYGLYFQGFFTLLLLVLCVCVREMCVRAHMLGGVHMPRSVWRPEDNLVGMVLPTFTWVSGIKLRLPGLHGQHLYPLSHLIGAPFFFLNIKMFLEIHFIYLQVAM